MHWTLIITGLLVAWAMLAGPWRWGSVALAASWCVGQSVYVLTGNELPIGVYWITDPIVMFILWRWAGSKLDYAILALFPACWWAYLNETGAEQWWTLWVISSLQLFLAGPFLQTQRILSAVSHGPRRAGI